MNQKFLRTHWKIFIMHLFKQKMAKFMTRSLSEWNWRKGRHMSGASVVRAKARYKIDSLIPYSQSFSLDHHCCSDIILSYPVGQVPEVWIPKYIHFYLHHSLSSVVWTIPPFQYHSTCINHRFSSLCDSLNFLFTSSPLYNMQMSYKKTRYVSLKRIW